jgi:hypothetical protein
MTAVEYLENILHDFIHPEHGAEFFPYVEKAKEMEKQQIIEAFNSGQAKEASECFWTKGNYYYQNKYGQHTNGNI